MPQGSNEFNIDAYLTSYVQGYDKRDPESVAVRATTRIPVMNESDKFKIINKGSWFRDEVKVRPLGGANPSAHFETSDDNYSCEEYGLGTEVDDRVRKNNRSPIAIDEAKTRFLARKHRIKRDRVWTDKCFKTGVWGTDLTGASSSPGANEFLQFDQSGSDPVSVVDEYKETMAEQTGFQPNVIVMGPKVYRTIRNHSAIIDRFKHTVEGGKATKNQLLSLFEVDEILVPRSIYNSADEGAADAMQFITDKTGMLMLYRAEQASTDMAEPTAAAMFTWDNLVEGQGNEDGAAILRRRGEKNYSDEFDSRAAWDIKVTASDLGIFFSGAVA